jgi:hypothetical protein
MREQVWQILVFHNMSQTKPHETEFLCSDTSFGKSITCMNYLLPSFRSSSVSGNEKHNLEWIYAIKRAF